MRLLLDTHALLWFVLDDPKLSATARAATADPDNDVLISPASYWEIAIKVGLGKYELAEPFDDFMHRAIAGNGFGVLPISPEHAGRLVSLPYHHRDPFDRLLIAQAIHEAIQIIGVDPAFDAYPIERIW